ncbi:MAG: hypothetical protein IT378_10805 [Sandaracinaceae bacterium]|nr:hypothetical protein [Sandaracinaceae bacterium]
MRSLLLASLLVLAGSALVGCGSSAECAIDSDCSNAFEICVANACVPRGTMGDASVDAARPDAGPPDAGPEDAGSDAGFECASYVGGWTIQSATMCGTAAPGATVTITAGPIDCVFIAMSDMAGLGIDGTFSSTSGTIGGNLNVGALGELICTGTDDGTTLTFTCNTATDPCIVALTRTVTP